MGTKDFKDDINSVLKKYTQQNPEKSPSELKLNYMDVMVWIELSGEFPKDFIERKVKPYVQLCKVNKKPLECSITLLNVESRELTHFE